MTKQYNPCPPLTHAEGMMVLTAVTGFSVAAHAGQVRKYNGEPYDTHPKAVTEILGRYGIEDMNMLAAAMLHDTVEDNPNITLDLIDRAFGPDVAMLVDGLTNKFKGAEHGSRAARKNKEAVRLSQTIPEVKTIKLADKLHNLPDIIANDPSPDFVATYVAEARYLLDTALKEGHNGLWMAVDAVINDYYKGQKDAA